MKLNTHHISKVNEVLADQKLVFKDFENEMVDHICTVIENEYTDDSDFEVALNNELYSFQEHFYRPTGYYDNDDEFFEGLAALEMERFYETDKSIKRSFLLVLKKQLLTWRVLLWASVFFLLLRFNPSIVLANSYFSKISLGSLFGFILASMIPFSSTPTYRSEPRGLLQFLPKLHQWLRPKSAHLHVLRKLVFLPIGLLTVMLCFENWLSIQLTPLFLFSIILIIYVLVNLYFEGKNKNQFTQPL